MEDAEEQEEGYSACCYCPLISYFSLIEMVMSVYSPNEISAWPGIRRVYQLGSSTPTSTLTWISWFCSLPGHEYFCEVAEDFIEDDFNLTGLNVMVPFWKEAMEMVLDMEPGAWVTRIKFIHTA